MLLTDILVFALFAVSLHFIMGPGGMASFGHAAYFGLGAYGAALLVLRSACRWKPRCVAGAASSPLAGALVFGWFCVRLSGVYLAMLTLAFAQIAWSVAFQWDSAHRRLERPGRRLAGAVAGVAGRLLLPRACCSARRASRFLWRMLHSPFGYALRAARDSPLRAEAIGIDVRARAMGGVRRSPARFAGLAGALYAFSKGSISPETLSVPRSVDGLVMVLLGGVQTLTGPVWGAALFTWLQDAVSREIDYWRAAIGAVILLLVLAFPQGVAGFVKARLAR